MKHPNIHQLYIYWNRLRANRAAPERSAIEPADIRSILKDTFILSVDDLDTYSFRLAGTRTCSLFSREIKGQNFLTLFNGEGHEAMQTLLHSVCEDMTACVAGLLGENDTGHKVPLEVILLPLRLNGRTDARILGALAPLQTPYWLGMLPITQVHLASLRMIMPHQHDEEFGRTTAVDDEDLDHDFRQDNARRVRHLTVFDGGLQ